MTWEEFREKYETEVLPGLSEGTGECKASVFNHIESTINPQRLARIDDGTAERVLSQMLRDGGMKETTLAVHLAHLKPVLKWAVRQGYLRVHARHRHAEAGQGRLASHARPCDHRRRIGPDDCQGTGQAQARA